MKLSEILNGPRPASQGGRHLRHAPAFWLQHTKVTIGVHLCHADPSDHYFHTVLSFISPFKNVCLSVKYFNLSGIRLKLFFHLSQIEPKSLKISRWE